jgi:hypothetical protein
MFYYNELVGAQNLHVDDDGLTCQDVRAWAETKYRLLALYDELFSAGMKNKWDQRVYIDLYAGAGYSHVTGPVHFLRGPRSLRLPLQIPLISTFSARRPSPGDRPATRSSASVWLIL